MDLLKVIYIILLNLPRILSLIEQAKKDKSDQAEKEKIEEDLNEIDQAFKSRDPNRLRAVFKS